MGINHIETLTNPYNVLKKFRESTNANIILKDAVSFLMNDDDIYINYNPTVSMGKAGMGDVLAGFVGAFLARKLKMLEASKLALILQSKSFLEASKKLGNDSVQAKDVAYFQSKILKRMM